MLASIKREERLTKVVRVDMYAERASCCANMASSRVSKFVVKDGWSSMWSGLGFAKCSDHQRSGACRLGWESDSYALPIGDITTITFKSRITLQLNFSSLLDTREVQRSSSMYSKNSWLVSDLRQLTTKGKRCLSSGDSNPKDGKALPEVDAV
jgi:hypothetical protein